jgi:type IV pilus biogenesis protein CpaD/CtpE
MPEGTIDLSSMRKLRGAREVGSAADGQAVVLTLEMEDGSTERFAMSSARVGRFVASLLFASGVAANDRLVAKGQGAPTGEQAALIDIVRVNASSAPGADYVCIRMVVGEGANLDFRIPLAVVPALQGKIAEALSVAQRGA